MVANTKHPVSPKMIEVSTKALVYCMMHLIRKLMSYNKVPPKYENIKYLLLALQDATLILYTVSYFQV